MLMNTSTDEMGNFKPAGSPLLLQFQIKASCASENISRKTAAPKNAVSRRFAWASRAERKVFRSEDSSSLCSMENTPTGRLDFDQTDVEVFRKCARHRCRGWLRSTAQQEQRRTIEVASKLLKIYENSKQGPYSRLLATLLSVPTRATEHYHLPWATPTHETTC